MRRSSRVRRRRRQSCKQAGLLRGASCESTVHWNDGDAMRRTTLLTRGCGRLHFDGYAAIRRRCLRHAWRHGLGLPIRGLRGASFRRPRVRVTPPLGARASVARRRRVAVVTTRVVINSSLALSFPCKPVGRARSAGRSGACSDNSGRSSPSVRNSVAEALTQPSTRAGG